MSEPIAAFRAAPSSGSATASKLAPETVIAQRASASRLRAQSASGSPAATRNDWSGPSTNPIAALER
jgi:hypothetical protein